MGYSALICDEWCISTFADALPVRHLCHRVNHRQCLVQQRVALVVGLLDECRLVGHARLLVVLVLLPDSVLQWRNLLLQLRGRGVHLSPLLVDVAHHVLRIAQVCPSATTRCPCNSLVGCSQSYLQSF